MYFQRGLLSLHRTTKKGVKDKLSHNTCILLARDLHFPCATYGKSAVTYLVVVMILDPPTP